ncbi:uncharacterized protein LOC144656631 isoform X2 [Oculina patagonica]
MKQVKLGNGMKRYRAIKCLETIERDLQDGNSAKAEETLQKCHKYLQELIPNDFSNLNSEEIQLVERAEQIYIKDEPWNSKNGSILLAQESSEEHLFVRWLNAFGVLASKMYDFDIAVDVLEQSVKYIDDADDEKLNFSLAVAQNNLGCVYICKGLFQNAKESLKTALRRFEMIKNSTNGYIVEEDIVTVLNNLRQVHQAQRNYAADQQVQNDLLSCLHQAPLPPRIIAIVEYNEACASLDNHYLRKALNAFEKLKTFCETKLQQDEEVVKCISLKICLVYLLLGNSSKTAAIIDTDTIKLPELIELVSVKSNFPLGFSVTVAEILVDICVNQGNQDLACKLLAYLVTICRETCGANHPTFATIMLKQGLVFSIMGKTETSRQCLRSALEIFTRAFGAVHPDVLKCETGLVRLESSDGLQEKSLLHCQRVLENVEKIYQISFVEQLKEKFEEKFEHSGKSIPETDQEVHFKLESLVAEFGVEISGVLSQHQPSDLGDDIVSLPEVDDSPDFPISSYPEEICAKFSLDYLKTGLSLFSIGRVAQSIVFLLLSCNYTKMFHNYLDCSDVILVQVIFVLCHLKATKDQRILKEKLLRNKLKVLRNYIEGRSGQHNQPERKTLFFDETVNLKVSLALFVQYFEEMEMFDMIDVVHGLFSKLQNHHSQKMTTILLVEELRFVFCSSSIECLGRIATHDLIFTTPLATMYSVQNHVEGKTHAACKPVLKDQNSFHKDNISAERQPRNVYRILALKRDKIPFERFCRFLVYCPISYDVDIAVLKQISDCSVKSVEDILPQLILRNQNRVTSTQYFIELEPLVSLETDISFLLGDLTLLPLILSSADEGAKSEMQPLVFITTAKTCDGTVAFIFSDRATSRFVFGQLMKQIFTNLEKLGEIADVGIVDDHLVLKIQSPFTGQIVMWCVGDSIKIKTQLIQVKQSPVKREICHEEISHCNGPIINRFFAEEIERCAGSFGIPFEEQIEKAWCIVSLLPETGHKTQALQGKGSLPYPASPLRMESPRESSGLSLSNEEDMLSESCTQTDSLSIPITYDFGTQTDESSSSHHLENSIAGCVTDASDATTVSFPSNQMNSITQQADVPVKGTLTIERNTPEDDNIGRSEDPVVAITFLGESTPDEPSSARKLNWPPCDPKQQDDSKREQNEKVEDETVPYRSASEIKDGSNTFREGQRSPERRSTRPLSDTRTPDVIPLTSTTDQHRPCVELPNLEQHPVKPSPTGDWRGDVVDDMTGDTANNEVVIAGKKKPRPDVTDISCYRDQAKAAPRDHHPYDSLSATAKSPYKGGDAVADDSPRHADHGASNHIETSGNSNPITLLRAAHETKCSDEGLLGAGRSGGLKVGRKDQPSTNYGRNDTQKLDESSNWSRNGAKPKKNIQRSSNVPFSTKKVDKGILSEGAEEANCFGIRPFFLARHTDDNSISITNDMCNMENIEEKPSDILSGYQRFGCYPDRSYHTPPRSPPTLLLPEGPDCSAVSQGPIRGTAPSSTGTPAFLNSNEQTYHHDKKPAYPGYDPCYAVYPSNQNISMWNLPPPPPFPSLPCDESGHHTSISNGAVQPRSPQFVPTAGDILFAQTPSSTQQVGGMTSLGNTGLALTNNVINQTDIGQSAISANPTPTSQNVILQSETSSASRRATRQQEQERIDREMAITTAFTNGESTTMQPELVNNNSHTQDDDSLAALERRVAEACSLVERVLKEREEREKAMKERERRQREERAQRELQERHRREREARKVRQSGEGTSTGSEEEAPSQHTALPESPQWLCEHYQRLCRVKFPCCGRFYPCHRCHNNSDECINDNCKAKEAFYIECSVCRHQQVINQDAQTCARCKTKMSAYFCSICKHFTGEDKYPYHCTKCGICRIHKDRSFHCDVCNVCLDKRLQGKHKCRANSGHDECCICLEDAFSGCQILPCSHKVHRECAIAMIQNGVRSCPICRHPLYSQTGGTE